MAIVLQVNFIPGEGQGQQTPQEKIDSAKAIAAQPGLLWKVWIEDKTTNTRGGIYLFEDVKSARAWGDDILAQRLRQAGATGISIRYFDVNEAPSLITRAPLGRILEAAA